MYMPFLVHMSTLTKASVVSSTILMYITTAKFGNDAWYGSYESFILHWQKQVSEYEKLVDIIDKFSNTINRSMLVNSFDGLAELRNVKKNYCTTTNHQWHNNII